MSASVFELLRQRYQAPAWAFLEEVRNQTGYRKGVIRTADALAMSLYPSRGLHLHGFEVKVSRADWKKELDDPAKAEELAQHCHFWWLVIGDPKIVQVGELPATWGLLVKHGDKLKCEKEPMFNKEAKAPDHAMLAAILRKVAATATEQALLDRARTEGHQAGYIEGKKDGIETTGDGRFEKSFRELQERVDVFEKASGIKLGWKHATSLRKLGQAIALLVGEWNSPLSILTHLQREAKKLGDSIDAVVAEVEREMPKVRDADEETGSAA